MTAPYDLSADTVIVPGARTDIDPSIEVLDVLRQAHGRGTGIASICCGAFILAAAGLLDGRRATTHWTSAAGFAERFPRVEVDPNVLFVDDDCNGYSPSACVTPRNSWKPQRCRSRT